jgi:PAS domain S-box-containing protein
MVVSAMGYRRVFAWFTLTAVGVSAFTVAVSWALPKTLANRPQPWETVVVWLVLAAVPAGALLLRRREIAERRIAELTQAKRRLSAYAETGDDVLWEMDPHGVITYIAPTVQDFLGYAPDEVMSCHADVILPPREWDRIALLVSTSAAKATGWTDEPYTFLTRDGREVRGLSSGVAHVGAGGEVKGFTGTVRRPGGTSTEEREAAEKRARVEDVLRRRAVRTVFQPIADVATGSVIGAEALSRFGTEPEVSPDRWFTDAAEVGLGTELDLLAIETALTAARELPAHVYLSVNAAPDTLCTEQLATLLRTGLWRTAPLVVEITEHASVENYELLAHCIDELRRRGLRLAVDDAGAGYASFRHILDLSPDYIKLDRALIDGMDRDPARRALVSAVVTFGREVNAAVVAEGVETPDELRTARALDVDAAQGYLIGRPAPAGPGWGARDSAVPDGPARDDA